MQPLVEPVADLSPAEVVRTARHAVLRGIGYDGQCRLAAARIAVIGAGGIGSPVIQTLAAAGIGTLVVIDDDVVDGSNLQRQVIHRIDDIGTPKVDSAARVIAALSPETRVVAHRTRLDADNAAALLADVDLVVDGSDSFATRRAVAAACEAHHIPLVWGAVQEWSAQATIFWSRPTDEREPVVLGDLYPEGSTGEPPTCAEVGVLGSLCVQVGGLLATEAIKLVTGAGEPLLGRIAVIDARTGRQHELPLRHTEGAPA